MRKRPKKPRIKILLTPLANRKAIRKTKPSPWTLIKNPKNGERMKNKTKKGLR